MKIQDIELFVSNRLSDKRFKHTLGTVETAKELAKIHGVSEEAAHVAALLHDVAKELPEGQLMRILRVSGELEYLNFHSNVWHAPMGAIVARQTFGIDDMDVLNSIRYHTTGRAGMSVLEKIIFIADYAEPGRSQDGVDDVRAKFSNLDAAMELILKRTIEKLGDGDIHPDTIAAYEFYRMS